jgi:hypothetical protein
MNLIRTDGSSYQQVHCSEYISDEPDIHAASQLSFLLVCHLITAEVLVKRLKSTDPESCL